MIVTYDQLPEIREEHRDKRIAFGRGVFDLVHRGHVEGLEFRKSLADILVCGVVSDEQATARKRPPSRNEQDRLVVIDAFSAVDYSFLMSSPTDDRTRTLEVVETLQPDIYVEFIENVGRWSKADLARMALAGTELVFDNQPKSNSTTSIMACLATR